MSALLGSGGPLTDPEPTLHRQVFEHSPTLAALRERVSAGGLVSVGRASPGPAALALADLWMRLERPMLVVTAGLDDADRLRRDWATFLPEPPQEFPLWESLFEDDADPDPETFVQRHGIVEALAGGQPLAVVAPLQALLQPVARSRRSRADRRLLLRSGDGMSQEELARVLIDAGFRRFPQVARPGDFSIRGGIFDLFPREAAHPYRIDYFGDEIESIRVMSMADQRSHQEVDLVVLTLLKKSEYFIRGFTGDEITLLARLPPQTILALHAPRDLEQSARSLIAQWSPRNAERIASEFWSQGAHLTRLDLEPLPVEPGRNPVQLPVGSTETLHGALDRVCAELRDELARGTQVEIYFRQLAEAERFREILAEHEVGPAARVFVGDLSDGFRWQEEPAALFLSGSRILGRMRSLARKKVHRRQLQGGVVDSFLELDEGGLVVHVAHGIGRYRGVRDLQKGHRRGDHLVIEFRDGVHVLVPATRIHLVQKFLGGPDRVVLDRVGAPSWAKRRDRVERAIHDLASEMLEVEALRAEREGFAFPADSAWQREFEEAFPFQETDDQLAAMIAIREDLESDKPMDRLVCGDVGYGKTELAMRAAFKVVQSGKQVAVVVPTTVLAQQHAVTFHDRMAEFPVRIESLSRLRSRREQLEILERARQGEVDILIGTHRLFSKDVSFADLGLIVIDEEQRFGVIHKERLKQLRRMVDILTLTATPIPRTLHLSLLGLRDISSLHDAPEGRSPVQTEVTLFEDGRFREIILRELNRDGQVFWVHNRVKSIAARCQVLQELVPEARMVCVHGQMNERELEERMRDFLEKRYNVLVTTTIIESGLDIPSANTIVIERADRFGLADLHQLRGRVGRGRHKAYAYLLLPEDRPVTPDARTRLQAIEEFSDLGAGFQIAARDLEIRGAGNILGKEQSGHIATIGYDLYCRLLEKAIAQVRGLPFVEPPDVEIAFPGHCRIPEDYVPTSRQRLHVYRAAATALDEATLAELADELVDRYGPLPETTRNLLDQQAIRIELGRWGARRASLEDDWLLLAGESDRIERGIRARGWELVKLPDGELAGRPTTNPHLRDLADVAAVLLGREHAGSCGV